MIYAAIGRDTAYMRTVYNKNSAHEPYAHNNAYLLCRLHTRQCVSTYGNVCLCIYNVSVSRVYAHGVCETYVYTRNIHTPKRMVGAYAYTYTYDLRDQYDVIIRD